MPIYEFSCRNCRRLFSFFSRRVNTSAVPPCPKCGAPLERMVSLFSARSGGGNSDPDPFGAGDDGLDEDFPGVPDWDSGDERIAGAVAEMGDKLDRIDPSNPTEAARAIKEFSEKSGVKLNPKVMDAIGKLASGDDSAEAGMQLAEALEGGHLVDDLRKAASKCADDPSCYEKDPALYDM